MNFFPPVFGTKAETLAALGRHTHDFRVPDTYFFTVSDWTRDSADIIRTIGTRFADRVAVRSSAVSEDGNTASLAGKYVSRLNINAQCPDDCTDAIECVIASYDGNASDQILIQEMVGDVEVAGVIMSHNLDDGAPYYVFGYDDESGRTDAVTGGFGVHKTVLVHHEADERHIRSVRIQKMHALIRNLETVFGRRPMDVEFAIDRSGVAHVFQVRPITTSEKWSAATTRCVNRELPRMESVLKRYAARRPGLAGRTNILGNMPDWNPAEIIGSSPRPLATSLYRHLVTKDVWHIARAAMGYRKLPGVELLVEMAGRPFIDVRASFNSFLPNATDAGTAEKLVDSWLSRLDRHPEFHDKIEFEIASTAYDFLFEQNQSERYPGVLSTEALAAYRNDLKALTARNLALDRKSFLGTAERQLETLRSRRTIYEKENKADPVNLLGQVVLLLNDCRRLGTQPFAVIARQAFIAEALLRSAVARGAICDNRVLELKRSINTVSRDISRDLNSVCKGALDKSVFWLNYGHLRPGSYDITSPRYSDRKNLFENGVTAADAPETGPFVLNPAEARGLDGLLKESGLDHLTAAQLIEYAGRAIRGREYGKLIFTWNLSAALENIAEWGKLLGLSRDDVSFLPVDEILSMGRPSSLEGRARAFVDQIAAAREDFADSHAVKLGYLIRDVHDLYVLPVHRSAPNFVTSKRTEGRVAHLENRTSAAADLRGAIACIENADPGFDWIFAKGISGLITKFGGMNSHMAVRCAEFGLPAAIGCGEDLFDRIVGGPSAVLDCANKTLVSADEY